MTATDLNYTVQYNYTTGYLNSWSDGSNSSSAYVVTGFKYHVPSEHTIDGNYFDLELQIGHADASGNVVYIVIFFDRVAGGNSDNPFFTSLGLGPVNYTIATSLSNLTLMELIKDATTDKSFYQYTGSSTNPLKGCAEGVVYNVIKDAQPLSDAQYDVFFNKWANATYFANGNGNNRAIQALNGRTIYFYEVASSGASYLYLAGVGSAILTVLSYF